MIIFSSEKTDIAGSPFPSSYFHPERPATGLSWEGARPL
jgi:hypothetical protein